jgi:hypothetical protein
MMDGLFAYESFLLVWEHANKMRDLEYLTPKERDAVVELAQRRFLSCAADALLVNIVNRLTARTEDATSKAKPGPVGPKASTRNGKG